MPNNTQGDEPEQRLEFKFEGNFPDAHSLPVDILIQFLEGARRAIYLFGMQTEGKSVKTRLRVPAEIEKKFALRVLPPKESSFLLPALIGDTRADLLARQQIHQVVDDFKSFGKSLAGDESQLLSQLVPDSRNRRHILEAFRSMSPRPGSDWQVSIYNSLGAPFTLTEETVSKASQLLTLPEDVEAIQTVTGKLQAIDFGARKVTIFYPPTSRELECFYSDDVEELLVENRRDMIQITGRVVLDEHSLPKKISEVQDIRDLDLSPFKVSQIPFGNQALRFREALEIEPKLTEDKQALTLEHAELGIMVLGATREELASELHSQITFLWKEYAQEEDSKLDEHALAIKNKLLAAISEILR
ncbi:MAG: hypothetical protein H0X02_11915 [Nitrosomonas sp.]|nr:hypothetical protein [Nitrosomonas sp.]